MEIVDSEVFDSKKAVSMDGKHFVNCRFTKTATVIYEGGEWAETNCTFEPGFKISLAGMAMRVMQFAMRFGMMQAMPMPPQTAVPPAKPPSAVQ